MPRKKKKEPELEVTERWAKCTIVRKPGDDQDEYHIVIDIKILEKPKKK